MEAVKIKLVGDQRTIDELISDKAKVKKKMDVHNSHLKDLRAEESEIDSMLLTKMETEGIERTANHVASVSVREEVVPNVENWDEVYPYIVENELWSLLHRRISSTSFREIIELGEQVPGITTRTLRKITFRSN
tara:strand:+ start:5171 stop:5572 length:402 start_codon:yes stop_codon:yes gene_type:complete